jgi:hypothetical protein
MPFLRGALAVIHPDFINSELADIIEFVKIWNLKTKLIRQLLRTSFSQGPWCKDVWIAATHLGNYGVS